MRSTRAVRLLATTVAVAASALCIAVPQAQAAAAATPDCYGTCVLGVRAATHPTFDRFVIDLGEGPIPAWTTTTQTTPLTCCGDETNEHVVPITGQQYLKIKLAKATGFDFANSKAVYTSPDYFTYNFPSLKGQGRTGTTDPEAHEFNIGLALGDHSSYRISKLTAPNRIVVDINR
ncbi:hypothetical protein PV721_22480 [Streptomyces sp. MB09-01]|uniref:AMIN-like domain-containing (lipo)protein n=1 Tax=Streptomyces sp. MB09-01 TaxID=3028666 RepID=UPI0029B12E3D|nr:hypothetical protein [Streptomyces sp. MB09-01]MDX3537091.1 hypothetical protein [Streptomyces sp. MB09-01]